MFCWQVLLVMMLQLLVELLARFQASELDLDVVTYGKTTQLDHLPGQVCDFHRLAHIQDENLTALPHYRCLHD